MLQIVRKILTVDPFNYRPDTKMYRQNLTQNVSDSFAKKMFHICNNPYPVNLRKQQIGNIENNILKLRFNFLISV